MGTARGFLSQFWGQFCCATAVSNGAGMEELQDATEFEAVEAPANIAAEVRFSDLELKLRDDAQQGVLSKAGGSNTYSIIFIYVFILHVFHIPTRKKETVLCNIT